MTSSLLEPLERHSLAEQAVRSLKRLILAEGLKPGSRLPSERQLAETLGISRNVVREALRTLIAEGYITKSPGKGAFLQPYDPQRLESELDEHLKKADEVRQLREIRVALEVGAMPFIVRRILPKELVHLRELVARMKARYEVGEPLTAEDREFHDILTAATHNESLISLRNAIVRTLRLRLYETPADQERARSVDANTVCTAEQLVEALERRDLEAAERAIRAHLIFVLPPVQARLFLFVDDEDIAGMHHVTRTVHQATKHPANPILIPEHPWEGEAIFPSATVLYDAEQREYRMWYHGYRHLSPTEEQYSLCYATSVDGIHWRKPALGIVEFDGSTENNLLIPWGDPRRADTASATIFYDPDAEEPSKRYVMLYFCSGMYPLGLGVAFSSDGLHWQPVEDNPVDAGGPEPIGDVVVATHEPGTNRAVAYYCVRLRVRPRRTLARAESTDLLHWTGHRVILAADEHDAPDAELHGLTPFRYGDLMLGFLWVSSEHNTKAEIQLAYSRDGVRWHRIGDRQPVLSPGSKRAFDAHIVMRTTVPIIVGNELWFYYMGAQRPIHEHGTGKPAIGLATLTMDRFVSLDAGDEEGEITMKPVAIGEQTKLLLNAITNSGGYILAELLNEQGQPIPGFTRHDAIPFRGTAVFHPIAWAERTDLAELAGQIVQIRFILRKARLFAFRLCRPDAAAADLLAGIC